MLSYTYVDHGKLELRDIEAAYDLFENRRDGVIKVAITNE